MSLSLGQLKRLEDLIRQHRTYCAALADGVRASREFCEVAWTLCDSAVRKAAISIGIDYTDRGAGVTHPTQQPNNAQGPL